MDQPAVVAVDVDRERAVTVEWDDGRRGRFALDELRRACPCAACRGRRDRGLAAWPLPGGPDTVTVASAELVGAWGISFRWSDGHGTGIYAWDTLRSWLEAGDAEETGETGGDPG